MNMMLWAVLYWRSLQDAAFYERVYLAGGDDAAFIAYGREIQHLNFLDEEVVRANC